MTVLTQRQRKWLDALLVLATVAVGFVVLGDISNVFFWLGDILLVFFLAWLLAFVLSPLVNVVDRGLPRLPRVVAVVIVSAQQLAVASLGALGNVVILLILSLYMVVDSERIVSFLFRLVPASMQEEARLLERSIAQSFGGFLRGQAIMGFVYFGVALVANAAG